MKKEEYLKQIDRVIANGKYRDTWCSLTGHKTPDWYYNGKLGIFIHWGVYSVPAFGNEWYSRAMYDRNLPEYEYHRRTYGTQKEFGYKDFIPMFQAQKFNAEEWVYLFKKAGAKFVMPVAEHHDGFAMYDTEFNRWNAKNMGPCRDVIKELRTACEENGLNFCASTHRAEHYFFMNMGRTFDSDVNQKEYEDFYGPAYYCEELYSNKLHETTADIYSISADREFLEDWLVRTCEIIDKYRPGILYFDWWIQNQGFKPYVKKLAAYYYNRAEEWGKEVTINYKHEAFPPGVGTFDIERGALTGISPVPWQTDTAIGKKSWGYIQDNDFKSSRQIICDFIDIVSKNGMLLLNIGPRPDGTVTEEETKVLEDMGAWLAVYGEGIYSTTFWKTYGEGNVNAVDGFFMDNEEKKFTKEDFRFTYKDGYVYIFWMKPEGDVARIRSFANQMHHDFLVRSVGLLGYDNPLLFERSREYMTIRLPETVHSELPMCFKVEIE